MIRKILNYESSMKTQKVKVSNSCNKSASPHFNSFLFFFQQKTLLGSWMKENFGNERLLITNNFLKTTSFIMVSKQDMQYKNGELILFFLKKKKKKRIIGDPMVLTFKLFVQISFVSLFIFIFLFNMNNPKIE